VVLGKKKALFWAVTMIDGADDGKGLKITDNRPSDASYFCEYNLKTVVHNNGLCLKFVILFYFCQRVGSNFPTVFPLRQPHT
jgi:hypothetical protein